MIDDLKKQVYELLCDDNSGHDMEHIERVLDLSLSFAKKEHANKDIVSLIALLHDVDDYKLFGMEDAKNLTHARAIMANSNISNDIQSKVLSEIGCIGYSKRLKGISPQTIEGKIVSDADMCDALGANGIIRVYTYSMTKGKPFFDRNSFPIENMTADKYISKSSDSSVCHFFEKILKLKYLMLTQSGEKEAYDRDKIVIDFLYHLFKEDNALEWIKYLDNYLEKNRNM